MSRIVRLREYAKPTREANWQGAGRDQANIDRWSDRATDNCKLAPHATGLDVRAEAHSTGRQTDLRDTRKQPRTSRKVDAAMRGDDDLNHVGSSFMAGTRRQT